jgi:diguanylate cyclase (GGDEF)-like protein/PAS domain S-box-containing protein
MAQAKVLVVEDERIIALDLRQQLQALGYVVIGLAASGEQAVAMALELKPDLVLMDIHLEGAMDGIEAAQAIHAHSRIPVVFLTAYAEDETLKRAQASLPFGYLVKPSEYRELHATIRMALARHAAEVGLERSEERLRLALDVEQLGVWEWNTTMDRVTTVGPIDAIFGGALEAIGASWEGFLQRVHLEDRAAVQTAIEQALSSGQPLNLRFRIVRPLGAVSWVETYAKVYSTTPSTAARLVGVAKDITERKQIEDRLRQARAVFDTTAEGIFIMDSEHRIVSVNPAFSVITGYRLEEVVGGDPERLVHARRHSDQFYSRLESMAAGQWQGETYCRRKNGEVFPAWESVNVVRDEAGEMTHYVAAFSDITAMRQAEKELHQLSHHDPLTGFPNRLLFNDRLDQVLERAAREKQRCALLFLDLDGFKVINDTLGHSSGDLLLQSIASRLKGALRRSDTAARLGGDEFVVIMADIAHAEDGAYLARKLLETIAAPIELVGERITMSASVGLSVYPDDGADRHALLKAADTAMYHAKAQGRNRYCFYTRELAVRAAERMSIEQGLRRALEREELVLHYQPQVALTSGALTGAEALVRWQHPQQGLIAPVRFISIAEDSGLIEPLGRWVLLNACREAAGWLKAGGPLLRLSVNVSARQLTCDHFEETVREAIQETAFPAHQLEIEITESTLQVVEHSLHLLEALKALGVQIAIDDFGTGYSSLSLLKHLPIDRLKIDRSFVRDIPTDPNDVAIVEAIGALSRTLTLNITAEGVENEAQLETLRRLGCEDGQGYLFSPPLPLGELQRLINREAPWASLCTSSGMSRDQK